MMENQRRALGSGGPTVLDSSVLDGIRMLQRPGMPCLLTKMIDLYRSRTPALMDALDAAIDAGDVDGVRSAAHSLKSSSMNIGALGLSETFTQIETAARLGGIEGARLQYEQAAVQFADVDVALAGVGPG